MTLLRPTIAISIALATITGGAIALSAYEAFPHQTMSGQVYPTFCCQGTTGVGGYGDCAPIPSSAVTTDAQGEWVITLKAGDHPLATRPHVFKRAYKDRLPSIDGRFHLCLYPTEDKAQCFLAPPEGS